MAQARNGPSAGNGAIERLALRLAGSAQSGDPAYERDFVGLLVLLSPRIARLIRQYRLDDLREDAEQAAAIGLHRALTSFDPDKAGFGTHATWQIRGELQSLRHRMRLDQRRSAVNSGINTVSLEAVGTEQGDGERVLEFVDPAAQSRVEGGASDAMTWR